MDEIKKENFDLKLRVSLLQERLSRLTPENIETALAEVTLSWFSMMTRLFIISSSIECRVKSENWGSGHWEQDLQDSC